VQAPVQHGGSVISAAYLFGVVCGPQRLLRVCAVDCEEEQMGTQARPCRLVG
jgi:hypothetical protein